MRSFSNFDLRQAVPATETARSARWRAAARFGPWSGSIALSLSLACGGPGSESRAEDSSEGGADSREPSVSQSDDSKDSQNETATSGATPSDSQADEDSQTSAQSSQGEGDDDGDSSPDESGSADSGGSDDDASKSDGTDDPCGFPGGEDDIQLDLEAATLLPGSGDRAMAMAGGLASCGSGFVAWTDGSSGSWHTTQLSEAAQGCVALVDVGSQRAVWAAGSGELKLIAFTMDSAPEVVATLSLPERAQQVGQSEQSNREARVHIRGVGYDAEHDRAYLARGEDGLFLLDMGDDSLEVGPKLGAVSDARAVHGLADGRLLVADGAGGIVLLSAAGDELDRYLGFGDAQWVGAGGDWVFVSRGAWGIEVLQLDGDDLRPKWKRSIDGAALDMVFEPSSSLLFVNAGIELLRYRVDASRGELQLLSRQRRPGWGEVSGHWFRALVPVARETPFVLTDRALVPVTLGSGRAQAQVAFESATQSFFPAKGTTLGEPIIIGYNTGGGPLYLQSIEAYGDFTARFSEADMVPRPGCPEQFVVEPRESFFVVVDHGPADGEHVEGGFRVESSDPDDAIYDYRLEVNRASAGKGEMPPDFRAPTYGGGRFELASHRGEIVFLKLFNLF